MNTSPYAQPAGQAAIQPPPQQPNYVPSGAPGPMAQQQVQFAMQPNQAIQNQNFPVQAQQFQPQNGNGAPQPMQPMQPMVMQPMPQPKTDPQQQHSVYTLTANTSPVEIPGQDPPPKRGFFSIFKRRPQPGQQKPPELNMPPQQPGQPPLQAFQPPPPGTQLTPEQLQLLQQQQVMGTNGLPGQANGRPGGPPNNSEPPLPRDAQPRQALIGGNWIFLEFAPYFVATALQDTHLQLGLIIATGIAVGVLVLGLIVTILNLRKVFPHILELLMPVIFGVQLGVSYAKESYKHEIIRTFPFITNSALCGTCLLSMFVCYPVGYQYAQELVHRMYMRHTDVHRCGLYTTAFLTASLVTSCLLYLAPLCKGLDDNHWNALNLIFRIIYPCVATFLALLFVRFFPDVYLPNFAVVHGLNKKPPARLPDYIAQAMAQRPPAILDATMYQSTVDAATKVREGTTMRRATPAPPADGMVPGQLINGGAPPGGGFSTILADPGAGMMPGMPPGVYQDPQHSLYTYYAAGPPAPPPLAVYAVYGDYDSPMPAQRPLGAHPMNFPQPINNPLAAMPPRGGVPPMMYGGQYGRMPNQYGPGFDGPYPDGRRRMYGGYDQQPYYDGMPMPGRGYASAGGAGPYGLNLPYGDLAAGYDGRVPPYRNPDAIVNNPYGYPPDYDMPPGGMGYGRGGNMGYPRRGLAGTVKAPDPYGTKTYSYVGSVALTPGGQQPGRGRHATDGGGYGLGAELQQHPPPPASYSSQSSRYGPQPNKYGRTQTPPLVRTGAGLLPRPPLEQSGLDMEDVTTGLPILTSAFNTSTPARLRPRNTPPGEYGLEPETGLPGPSGPYGRVRPPVPPPPPPGPSPGPGGDFGLGAELDEPRISQPQTPYGSSGLAPPPALPGSRFGAQPAAESFGLDAEVNG